MSDRPDPVHNAAIRATYRLHVFTAAVSGLARGAQTPSPRIASRRQVVSGNLTPVFA